MDHSGSLLDNWVKNKPTHNASIKMQFLYDSNKQLLFFFYYMPLWFFLSDVNSKCWNSLYISDCWSGKKKETLMQVFRPSAMKTRYYCFAWPFLNMGYSILHNSFLVHASITDLYSVEN